MWHPPTIWRSGSLLLRPQQVHRVPPSPQEVPQNPPGNAVLDLGKTGPVHGAVGGASSALIVIVQPAASAVAPPNGAAGVPAPVLGPSQEAILFNALRNGWSFAQVTGSVINLGHFYGQHGAHAFRQDQRGPGASAWARGTGGPERRQRNMVQLKWQGEGSSPQRGTVVDMVLSMGFKVVSPSFIHTNMM